MSDQQLSGQRLRSYTHAIDILAEARDEQGLTIRRLAELSGHGREQISDWLRCKHSPVTPSFFDLAQTLGYDLALIPREDAP